MNIIQAVVDKALNLFTPNNEHDLCVDCYDPYEDDPPCVIGKEYFTHLRRWVWSDKELDITLSNFGGATLCWRVEKGQSDGTYWLVYTWSTCNLKEKDQFCRKTGRENCLENFKSKPRRLYYEVREGVPTITETRDYVIDQYKSTQHRFYKKIWTELY